MSRFHVGQEVLRQGLSLRNLLEATEDYELWTAEFGERLLVKLWPFLRDEPSSIERTLWDRELRTLYRLASTLEAEDRLVTLVDASVDRKAKTFGIVLKAPGFDRLSTVLADRTKYPWLRNLKHDANRAALWRGLMRLLQGLAHVHLLRSLHSAVVPANVFLDANEGPESFRLGGFEWTVRLGRQQTVPSSGKAHGDGWRVNASLNSDWLDLGVLAAQLFGATGSDATELRRSLLSHPHLLQDERYFLDTLLRASTSGALDRDDLEEMCSDVIGGLTRSVGFQNGERVGAVVSLRRGYGPSEIAQRIAEVDPSLLASDEVGICRWIENDLREAEIVAVTARGGLTRYFLKGIRLPYGLRCFQLDSDAGEQDTTWSLANLHLVDYIDERTAVHKRLPFPGMVSVFATSQALKAYRDICKRVRPWLPILPQASQTATLPSPQLEFLRRFLPVTNEIERAIRETEIYPVRSVGSWLHDGLEYLLVEEEPRQREHPLQDRIPPLVKFLSDEDARLQAATEIYVGPESELWLSSRVAFTESWGIAQLSGGNVQVGDAAITVATNQVLLNRAKTRSGVPTEKHLFLRLLGMFGQVALLDRRTEAIELLATHTFLQRAIALPDTVQIDTGMDELPVALPPEDKFDEAKRRSLLQTWQTRPIFCLQGPPGTGKTTLVGQLLRQIYEDDGSCQVLLTAQAGAAVDHLRDEVAKFVAHRQNEHPTWVPPVAVRIRKPKRNDPDLGNFDSASPSVVAKSMLRNAVATLETRGTLSPALTDWLDYARKQVAGIQDEDDRDGDFERLVRRSANFVYMTSNAQDLQALAREHQTFDWSIIEEAGKAHGVDLVLPLQTGHRWLLIGDQDQLSPYRDKDFCTGFERLEQLAETSPTIRRVWNELGSNASRQEFANAGKEWLYFFKALSKTCKTRTEGKLIAMLTDQHRMHPDIGALVSTAFYNGSLKNRTIDTDTHLPIDRVLHRFSHPEPLVGKAVVWIDVPTCGETGHEFEGYRQNRAEASAVRMFFQSLKTRSLDTQTCAVLSPYRLQLKVLRDQLSTLSVPSGLLPPDGKQITPGRLGVFTVDSFQGHQAAIVVVSLVRNNQERDTNRALGFLAEYERMNVMVSRAEKLLVLVGAWDFFESHLASQPREAGQPYAELALMYDWLVSARRTGRLAFLKRTDLGLCSEGI